MRNYLLEKSCTICGGETSSKPFFKNLIIFLHQKFLVCLCCISKSRTTKINWNQGPDHLLLTHIIPFWKTKGVLQLVSLPHALHHFWRKLLIKVYSINWPNFIAWLSLLLEILGNMFILIVFVSQLVASWILKSTLALWSRRFPIWPKKSIWKFKYMKNKRSF